MTLSKAEAIRKGREILCEGLRPFVERELRKVYGDNQLEEIVKKNLGKNFDPFRKPISEWDTYALLSIMKEQWFNVFKKLLKEDAKNYVHELLTKRNQDSHEEKFSLRDIVRFLDTGVGLLESIGVPQAKEMKKIHYEVAQSLINPDIWTDPSETLYIIPCSRSKELGSFEGGDYSISKVLSNETANRLQILREKKRELLIREGNFKSAIQFPAYRGYTGSLYSNSKEAIQSTVLTGGHILIISGAYGLVMAQETICRYQSGFSREDWLIDGRDVLSDAVLEYCQHHKVQHVRIVVTEGPYENFAKAVEWNKGNFETVILFSFHSKIQGNYDHLEAEGKCLSHLLEKRPEGNFFESLQKRLANYQNAVSWEKIDLYSSL